MAEPTSQRRRVLIVAYECSPASGSEAGNAWNWAVHLDRAGWNVELLTSGRSSGEISAALTKATRSTSLHEVPRPGRTPRTQLGGYIRYLRWQRAALERCRAMDVSTAVASASLNAQEVLDRLGLLPLVDFIADPSRTEPKPSAQIYRTTCVALGASPGRTACIEDGAPMIANLRAEGLYTVGIGSEPLEADEQVTAIAEWDVEATFAQLRG